MIPDPVFHDSSQRAHLGVCSTTHPPVSSNNLHFPIPTHHSLWDRFLCVAAGFVITKRGLLPPVASRSAGQIILVGYPVYSQTYGSAQRKRISPSQVSCSPESSQHSILPISARLVSVLFPAPSGTDEKLLQALSSWLHCCTKRSASPCHG